MSRGHGLGGGGIQRGWEVFVCQQLSHGLLVTEHGRAVHLLPFLEGGKEGRREGGKEGGREERVHYDSPRYIDLHQFPIYK